MHEQRERIRRFSNAVRAGAAAEDADAELLRAQQREDGVAEDDEEEDEIEALPMDDEEAMMMGQVSVGDSAAVAAAAVAAAESAASRATSNELGENVSETEATAAAAAAAGAAVGATMGLSEAGPSPSYSSYTGAEQREGVGEESRTPGEKDVLDVAGREVGAGAAIEERAEVVYGYTGRALRNVISVGIGGSYLGPCYVAEVLATEKEGIYSSQGFTLRFLSNVDPVDFERCVLEEDCN